jgi:hypothetical protein
VRLLLVVGAHLRGARRRTTPSVNPPTLTGTTWDLPNTSVVAAVVVAGIAYWVSLGRRGAEDSSRWVTNVCKFKGVFGIFLILVHAFAYYSIYLTCFC